MLSFRSSILLALIKPAFTEIGGCTSIAVGRGATLEGSSLATHNNDCDACDPRVAFIPSRDHAHGTKRPIAPVKNSYPRFVGAYRSETYAPIDGQTDTKPIGYIDEVPHTFSYWEVTYPILNEHGLGFSESTCAAHLVGRSKTDGGEALFCLAELMRIASERCKTAMCAIQIMGDLAVEHGFYGEDPGVGGAGESLIVTDREEAWVFHILGGLSNKSATWVAQRVPSDHVAVVANNFIIRKLKCSDKKNFMCSGNVFSNAREAKLCNFNSEDDFDFTRCYVPDPRTFLDGPGPAIPYYTTLRMWGILNLANPSGIVPSLTDDAFQYPFSVPVDRKVSRAEVMNWTRYYYQGTEFDMSQGVLAGPFNNPIRAEGGQGMLEVPGVLTRGISIARTNYAVVVESKTGEKASQSIAWFCTDQPLTGVFVPIVASSSLIAKAYQKGRLEVFDRDSAFWAFNFVSNWMNIDYKDMMEITVGPVQSAEQQHIFHHVESLEAAWPESLETLNNAQHALQKKLVDNWWALSEVVISQFSDGMFTARNGTKKSLGYSAWWLEMIGFNVEFTKVQWVQWAAMPPWRVWAYLPEALRTSLSSQTFLTAAGEHGGSHLVLVFFSGILIGSVGATILSKRNRPKFEGMSSPLLTS